MSLITVWATSRLRISKELFVMLKWAIKTLLEKKLLDKMSDSNLTLQFTNHRIGIGPDYDLFSVFSSEK